MLLFGNRRESGQILHQQIKSSRSEVSEVVRRECGAAVSAVIVAVNNQARLRQIFDQSNVPPDVFAQSMGDLNNASNRSLDLPAPALDAESVCACELEPVSLNASSTHVLGCREPASLRQELRRTRFVGDGISTAN